MLHFDYRAEIWRWKDEGLNETFLWTESKSVGVPCVSELFRLRPPPHTC